jgi:hypothetical protein
MEKEKIIDLRIMAYHLPVPGAEVPVRYPEEVPVPSRGLPVPEVPVRCQCRRRCASVPSAECGSASASAGDAGASAVLPVPVCAECLGAQILKVRCRRCPGSVGAGAGGGAVSRASRYTGTTITTVEL